MSGSDGTKWVRVFTLEDQIELNESEDEEDTPMEMDRTSIQNIGTPFPGDYR